MSTNEGILYANPPDLLRRFVSTPLKACYSYEGIHFTVETNDFTLLPELPLACNPEAARERGPRWKLVRDQDIRGPLGAPITLTSRRLTVVTIGTACLLGVDYDRQEALGFIGADVSPRAYKEYLVPFLCRLSSELRLQRCGIPRRKSASVYE